MNTIKNTQTITITKWPIAERPREKLLLHGPKSLSDAELIAIIFRTGIRGKTALDIARELLSQYGSLKKIILNEHTPILQTKGIGQSKYAMLRAAIELGCRYIEEALPIGKTLSDTGTTQQFLMNRLQHHAHEVFGGLFLDIQNRMICFEELFHGTLTEANVYPRELVKKCLKHNAAKIILAHNHPSGSVSPSESDIELTELLKKALDLIGVKVIDHIIVGHHQTFSFAEMGLI